MENLLKNISETISNWGFLAEYNNLIARLILVIGVIILAIIANFIAKRCILKLVKTLIEKSKSTLDNILLNERLFQRLAYLAPALVIHLGIGIIFPDQEILKELLHRIVNAYMIFVTALVVDAFFNIGLKIYDRFPLSRERSIKAYIQVAKIALYIITIVFIIAMLMNNSPWRLLSGLGAMTAVLMLVFKDSILGFVASIQLAGNDMLRKGDWIEMAKYGADGDVIDISLTTVKVQNWDKTITTIPTYGLISDSFKNWRGMTSSSGRRIKRSISIDMNSVKFLSKLEIDKLKKIKLLSNYLTKKQKELAEYNQEQNIVDDLDIFPTNSPNSRNLTNLGTFRAYVKAYLNAHPDIHKEMTLLVRQLAPSAEGIPIEIYAFSEDKNWANYERIQADIFDHLLAILSQFELRIFQSPSGQDFQMIKS